MDKCDRCGKRTNNLHDAVDESHSKYEMVCLNCLREISFPKEAKKNNAVNKGN